MAQNESGTVVYVYGVIPGDVEFEHGVKGVGQPPSQVRLVRSGQTGVLVSEIPAGVPLGTPEDLTAHARVLDTVAVAAPVLPLRFGAVLSDLDSVEREFLAPNSDTFASMLGELEGRAQYVLRGRYYEDAVLREVSDEDPRIAQLREQISGKPADATRDARIALGELIGRAVETKRQADTRAMAAALNQLGVPVVAGEATSEWDAVNVSCLLELAREDELAEAARLFAAEHEARITVRMLGPMAAYDFVTVPTQAA